MVYWGSNPLILTSCPGHPSRHPSNLAVPSCFRTLGCGFYVGEARKVAEVKARESSYRRRFGKKPTFFFLTSVFSVFCVFVSGGLLMTRL